MGCCISHPSGPNSPYPGGVGASASSRAINAQQQHHQQRPAAGATTSTTTATSAPSSTHRRTSRQPLDQHINKPLRRHEWLAGNSRTWTPTSLAWERRDFFDTRVTGRPEIWQTLRATLELIWEADAAYRANAAAAGALGAQDDGRKDALATAQTILSAAEITLPTGDLAQGAYDAMGNYYPIPEYVVSDPVNVAEEDGQGRSSPEVEGEYGDVKSAFTSRDADADGEETADEGLKEDDSETARRREEKGKGVADTRDQVAVRARLSEGAANDVTLSTGRDESVRSVARRIAEETSLSAVKKIRIAYMGKILNEGSSLSSQGWKEGHIINALVFNR